ncbi:unnamed protein product [Cylicostephanus goldi]|uniref:Uncharacterized protein n=1 Tax=Cylicostephanus goldi TaxID=71465 RepID=A0A3P6RLP9_CYLGO|nr:unnamed protein product [Cylicostephanus goldi]
MICKGRNLREVFTDDHLIYWREFATQGGAKDVKRPVRAETDGRGREGGSHMTEDRFINDIFLPRVFVGRGPDGWLAERPRPKPANRRDFAQN